MSGSVNIDYVAVGRVSHELSTTRGSVAALQYAERLAMEALTKGDTEQYAFWQAVADSLKPR